MSAHPGPISVQEVLHKARLFFSGFFLSLLLIFGLIALSPLFLILDRPFPKSDVLVLEAKETIPQDILKNAADGFKKGYAGILIVLYSPATTNSNLGVIQDLTAEIQNSLVALGVEESKILIYKLESYPIGARNFPKSLLKICLDRQFKNILILSKRFESSLNQKLYESVLGPAGLKIHVVPLSDKIGLGNWFLSEEGFEIVFLNIARMFYQILLGK
ncbi:MULTISPECIES: hypothetical protein [Leptospira]|uniref:DUF218 domain-containing protein n=7 Tax=Leptospira borgpetersenii TaxID=174 RepID=M3HM70_LEPBO|nr:MULTISPECIES: hypothetical protein [Leptospira]EMF99170.1 hypothetical protein LEP1GSC123_3423 [Leptospira borgpetersenii str. 200701203]EMO07822.1 hypothetical protein LEP1GSC137_1596 [Leptospira borgpetersenii str. Noumea 25]ABJ76095.1 Hypothetical protein LBJ_1522 [Leptospira borgpetersenii serovar Hardjo-bovis str. JB197]ABJ79193.1 Hypothetical protein LBL_1746 [Leptospira borgpetersenii serovar Hardjo-bovis str. L550]ALO25387.1 hypothetical protein LBBP_01080 [Leptospira borgpetersenii